MARIPNMIGLTAVEANTLYEALVLLGYFFAKAAHPERLPYNDEQIEALQQRILEGWPELRATHTQEPT
jgi:hypothetical protein